MTVWFTLIVGASVVAWVASRHGRNPAAWGLAALTPGLLAANAVRAASGMLDRSESASLVVVLLAPVASLAATTAVGFLAARPVSAEVVARPVVASAPEERFEMVRVEDDPAARGGGAPYRARAHCRLALGERMITLEGPPPARLSLAYRAVEATSPDPDLLRLAWTDGRGTKGSVLLRPAGADPDERAAVVADLVRCCASRRGG